MVAQFDMVVRGGNGMPHEGGADEPCPARHQKTLRHQALVPVEHGSLPFFSNKCSFGGGRRLTPHPGSRNRGRDGSGRRRNRQIGLGPPASSGRLPQILPIHLTAVIILGHFRQNRARQRG